MNEQTALLLTDITQALAEPFPIEDIELLPKGSIERDGKTLCMALPYADVRVYEDRLNKLAPGEWSTPPPLALVVGNKLVCYVTVVVCGIPHTDVGEADPSENQGTVAFAQAFKRACSQFGLGRYLYNLEKAWVPYNPQSKRIDLDAAGICQIVRGMYMKAGIASKSTSASSREQIKPSDINKARATWAKAYNIAESEIEARWPKYLVYKLGSILADPDIQPHHLALINGDIETQARKAS